MPSLVVSPAPEHVVRPSSRCVPAVSKQPSDPVDKSTSKRGPTKIFNDDGSLTVELTNKLKVRLADREHLEQHEIDLIHALLNSYLSSTMKSKQNLTKDEESLFGQFAVIAFSKIPDGQHLSLLNVARAKPIQLVQLPRQYKQGKEKQNKNLFKRRIRTGKAWIKHLPGGFNDELIAKMFVDIEDEEIVRKTLRAYHNKRLRLNAEDSASLKSFVGISDNAYIKLIRGLFYFTGLRTLAPVKAVRCLRKIKKEEDYSSMSRHVVDMIRETKKEGPQSLAR